MTDTDDPAAPDRDAAPTLTYEGTAIRQRGLMLNLTDMWRAAGGPACGWTWRNQALPPLRAVALVGRPGHCARRKCHPG